MELSKSYFSLVVERNGIETELNWNWTELNGTEQKRNGTKTERNTREIERSKNEIELNWNWTEPNRNEPNKNRTERNTKETEHPQLRPLVPVLSLVSTGPFSTPRQQVMTTRNTRGPCYQCQHLHTASRISLFFSFFFYFFFERGAGGGLDLNHRKKTDITSHHITSHQKEKRKMV